MITHKNDDEEKNYHAVQEFLKDNRDAINLHKNENMKYKNYVYILICILNLGFIIFLVGMAIITKDPSLFMTVFF